jgi:hypothetical protein
MLEDEVVEASVLFELRYFTEITKDYVGCLSYPGSTQRYISNAYGLPSILRWPVSSGRILSHAFSHVSAG